MGKRIIITAGGTNEAIDSVRNITNFSTGKLGSIIAKELLDSKSEEIDKIYYICPKHAIMPEINEKIELVIISDTNSVKENIEELLRNENIDCFIHSMAVSDYTVKNLTNSKLLSKYIAENLDKELSKEVLANRIEDFIKNNKEIIDTSKKVSSYEDNLIINLKQTPKIISIIKDISKQTYLVGFKLLNNVTEEELCNVAYKLLEKNSCDLVVANDLSTIKDGQHKAIIMNKEKEKIYVNTKEEIAKAIIRKMF